MVIVLSFSKTSLNDLQWTKTQFVGHSNNVSGFRHKALSNVILIDSACSQPAPLRPWLERNTIIDPWNSNNNNTTSCCNEWHKTSFIYFPSIAMWLSCFATCTWSYLEYSTYDRIESRDQLIVWSRSIDLIHRLLTTFCDDDNKASTQAENLTISGI